MQVKWELELVDIDYWLAKFMFIHRIPAKPNQAPSCSGSSQSSYLDHDAWTSQSAAPHFSPDPITAIMPPTPLTHRPQTLRQAKRAFRKSAGQVQLSESEKAAIQRRMELQERADRIKERETRRKANIKKREEKKQREREARHRMGIPSPPSKEGIQVGPSQLHLSNFICAGVKRKRETMIDGVKKESTVQKQEEQVFQEQKQSPIEPAKSPRSLKTLHPYTSSTCKMPPQIANANANSSKGRDLAPQEDQTPPIKKPPARVPLQARAANPILRQMSPAETKDVDKLRAKSSSPQKPQPLPMDPPPKRHHLETGPIQFKRPSLLRVPLKPPKPEPVPDDNLDDFFVSNTQIQRELSPPPTLSTKPHLHPIPTVRPLTPPRQKPPPTENEDAAHLLSLISTQDLDFSFDLTQKPPRSAAAPKISSYPSGFSSSEEGEGKEEEDSFPDTELDSIVLEFSLESPIESSHPLSTTSTSQHHQSLKPNHPQQHRKVEQQGHLNDWDTFGLELSTQDLLELDS